MPRGGVVMTVQLRGVVYALGVLLRGVGPRWFLAGPAYFASMAVAAFTVGTAVAKTMLVIQNLLAPKPRRVTAAMLTRLYWEWLVSGLDIG